MSTLLLRHRDVVGALQALFLLEDVRAGFLAHAEGQTEPTGQGAASPAGLLPEVPAYTAHAPAEGDAPPTLHLHAAEGGLLAVIEREYLSGLTHAVVGALAADTLARPDASRVALLGASTAAATQLKSLRLVRSLSHVRVYDEDPFRAATLAARLYREMSLPSHGALTPAEAVADADIVLCVLPELPEPLLGTDMLRAGTHLSLLGEAARPGQLLSPELLAAARVVADDARVSPAGRDRALDAELGQVLAGRLPGRLSAGDITVFTGAGLPFQELAAAWQVYQVAREDDSVDRLAPAH